MQDHMPTSWPNPKATTYEHANKEHFKISQKSAKERDDHTRSMRPNASQSEQTRAKSDLLGPGAPRSYHTRFKGAQTRFALTMRDP